MKSIALKERGFKPKIETIKAEIDTTLNKFEFEINSEFRMGQSIFITQENVVNLNRKYGLGIHVGHQIKPSHFIKLGISLNRAYYDYRIVKKNSISPSGKLIDLETYKEEINVSNVSFGIMYSIEIEGDFYIDFEVLAFNIVSEDKSRTDIDNFQTDGSIVSKGNRLHHKQKLFGFKNRYRYSISSHIKLGVNLLISNERISLPSIVNDSKFNLYLGISIAYKI